MVKMQLRKKSLPIPKRAATASGGRRKPRIICKRSDETEGGRSGGLIGWAQNDRCAGGAHQQQGVGMVSLRSAVVKRIG